MSLAKELSEKVETDVELQYFDSCRKFWSTGGEPVNKWTMASRPASPRTSEPTWFTEHWYGWTRAASHESAQSGRCVNIWAGKSKIRLHFNEKRPIATPNIFTLNTFITKTTRPAWEQLSIAIQTEWAKSAADFYPEGAISKADLEGVAKYDYEMAETLHPELFK